MCVLLEILLDKEKSFNLYEEVELNKKIILNILTFSFVWGFGACLNEIS